VIISLVRLRPSIGVIPIDAWGWQLDAFQLDPPPAHPSPDIAVTSPSDDDPSHLQTFIDDVITIQFPHWISGESHGEGRFPKTDAGHPIQIAVPIPRVRVGVTKIRRKLVGEEVPRIPPAHNGNFPVKTYGDQTPDGFILIASPQVGLKTNGESGHTTGKHHSGVGKPVNALKIGIEVGDPSGDAHPLVPGTGFPNIARGFPGAIGAQFSGKLRHHPPPNPQASPSISACVSSRNLLTA
jgi:hypothetical protein